MQKYDFAEIIPQGQKNKITARELMRRTGFSDIRSLRYAISSARKDGAIIATTRGGGGGYYIPTGREELVTYVREAEKQGASTFAPLKAAREKLRQIEGQQELTLAEETRSNGEGKSTIHR